MGHRRMSAPKFAAQKGRRKLVCLTAYDVLTAQCVDAAGVDLILVGDSLGNVVLGLETTLPVTLDDMISHAKGVMRAKPKALVVADMPFLSYHINPEETIRNAGRLIQEATVDAVKLEGGEERVPHIRALIQAEIPVMGHLGLTPQSVLEFGGYKIQGKTQEAALRLVQDATALQEAGCFSIVLEGIPEETAKQVTQAVSIPTIGIGAGPDCDGQILVTPDLLGLTPSVPKFVRTYCDLQKTITAAVGKYSDDVREGTFPGPDETYSAS